MVGPLYQRIGSNLFAAAGDSKSLFLAVVLSWDIGFLGVQSQTSWNYIQVPLPPICRSPQKITTENRLWYSFSFNNPRHFPPHPGLHETRLQHFSRAMQTLHSYCRSVFFYGWISTRSVPKKTQDTNIKCPSVSARACHPSCCTPVSSDERQPPNMWQGHGPCGKWFGKCSIYSVSQCLAFQTCNLQNKVSILRCWYCAFKIKYAQFCEFFSFCVHSITVLVMTQKGEDVQLKWLSVLDFSVEIMWIEMYV